ncbi:MAG: hypothetical protein ACLSHV_10975 [Hominisplanchenecus sp.]
MDFSKLAKSLNPYTIKKGFSYLKQYGFQEFKECDYQSDLKRRSRL